MSKLKSLYLIAASVFIIAAVVTICAALQLSHGVQGDSVLEQAKLVRDAHLKEKLSRSYGKFEIPAEVYIGLAQSENLRKPVEIIISASTMISANLARIIMIKPKTGSEPEQKETLWADTPDGLVDKTFVYNAGILPTGKHQFNVVLEFLTGSDNSKFLLAAGSLFLDVRPDGILSSNVSFDQIERLELHKELEKRVLVSMKPQLMSADAKRLSLEKTAMENKDPGIIDRKIQELIVSDPDIARRVEEINMTVDESVQSSELFTLSSQLLPDMNDSTPLGGNYAPISDVQVPVPDEFRN